MLLNYLKVAIRNLSRHKLFTFINIFGLALSMSVCMMVLISIKDQIGYDTFHPDASNTYRVITQLTSKEGNNFRFASSPLPLSPLLRKNYGFVKNIVRIYAVGAPQAIAADKTLTIKSAYTEPDFFKVFGFTLVTGDPKTALQSPGSIVLSTETAQKFFGTSSPLGKSITIEKLGTYQVTGVLGTSAGKSHIDFEAYLSFSSLPGLMNTGALPNLIDSWNPQISCYTYVNVRKQTTSHQLATALDQIAASIRKLSTFTGKENVAFEPQRLDNIILGEELSNSIGNVGSLGKTLATIVVGLVVLLSACFNYTNLSIARSLRRGKEVGIRKVAGAFRYQIFSMFIMEAMVIAFLSLALGWLLLKCIIAYAPFSGELDLAYQNDIISWFVLFAIFTGLLAGSLPAWVLSSFQPVQVLKNLSNVKLFGSNGFRKVLIIIQFALALFTIIFSVIASRQFQFIANADPGYVRENVLVLPLKGVSEKQLATELKRLSGIKAVAATSATFGFSTSGTASLFGTTKAQPISMDYYSVASNFFSVMGLTFVAGQTFQSTADTAHESEVVINETAAQLLHFSIPADAVGQSVFINDSIQVRIAGVVKNFHYLTVAVPLGPLMLRNRPGDFTYLLVKTTDESSATLAAIERVWKNNYPRQAFSYSWFDKSAAERQGAWGTVSMLGFLAFMTVTIACLGLLGMVIYTTETRRKEIGIRKVMGASVAAIISLLSKSFVRLILIAGLIAMPLGAIAGFFFLQIFASHTTIGVDVFLLSFGGLLVLVLLTIGSQIFRVASANPVNSLHTE